MKFYKVTLHKDLRNIDGVDVFAKNNVYWISLRITTHQEVTILLFGDDANIDALMAEYGGRATMTIHYGRELTAKEVTQELRHTIVIYPQPEWLNAEDNE